MTRYIAGVEGGGTTFVVSIAANDATNIIDRIEIPTTTPDETLAQTLPILGKYDIKAIGIACFGPLELNPENSKYGHITTTPKLLWRNFDVYGYYKSRFSVPISIQTDVNACAMSERVLGNHGTISSCAYITVGTGVGVGLVINGQPIFGISHPEGGHIKVNQLENDTFKGICPNHGGCIEGMTSAGALAARMDMPANQLASLPDDHDIWKIAAHYIGSLCASIALLCSPQVIVISGGVLKRKILFDLTRQVFINAMAEYVGNDIFLAENVHNFIKPSRFGNDAGAVGALFLGESCLDQ